MNTMHPHIFRDTWGLTNWEAASLLGLSERTIVAYCSSSGSISRRNPSLAVQRLTFIQHQNMLNKRED
jgi:DNA-binding XRE family transcriptional regulator